MPLFGGITLPNAPDLENVRKLDLMVLEQLGRMSRYGIAIDREYLAELGAEFEREKQELSKQISAYVPQHALDEFAAKDLSNVELDDDDQLCVQINASSAEQVRKLIFDLLSVGRDQKLKTTGAGKVSTGRKNLDLCRDDHPVVPLVLQYRERAKLKSAFCDALPPMAKLHPRGNCCPVCELPHVERTYRLHTEFPTTRAITGRLSSRRPNLQQIPIRTDLGSRIRAAFVASTGTKLVSVDFSQMELRDLAHLANARSMISIYEQDGDIHQNTAMKAFGITDPAKVDKYKHRLPSKRCIAKGQLVLTNKGLVPIENVSCNHLVWDGIEWVSHDGVVSNGIMPTILHNGLRCTPDHVVWTETGEMMYAAEAKRRGARLAIAGSEGIPVRFTLDHQYADIQKLVRVSGSKGRLQPLWFCGTNSVSGQYREGQYDQLQVSACAEIRRPGPPSGRTIRSNCTALLEPKKRQLAELRRSRYQEQLQRCPAFSAICTPLSAASYIQRRRYRPKEQRRPLRTGQPETGDTWSECTQQTKQSLDYLQRDTNSGSRPARLSGSGLSGFQSEVQLDRTFSEQRFSLAGDCEQRNEVEEVEVFDVVNAGPRHRYVVENKLVSNTNFGIQNGTTEKGLHAQLVGDYWASGKTPPDFLTEDWCRQFIADWHNVYPEVQPYFNTRYYLARRYGFCWDPWGRVRYIPQVQSSLPWKVHEGLREAQNFAVTASNAEQTKLAMAECEDVFVDLLDAGVWVWPLLSIHDQIMAEVEEEYAEAVGDRIVSVFEHVMDDRETGERLWRCKIKSDCEILDRWKAKD